MDNLGEGNEQIWQQYCLTLTILAVDKCACRPKYHRSDQRFRTQVIGLISLYVRLKFFLRKHIQRISQASTVVLRLKFHSLKRQKGPRHWGICSHCDSWVVYHLYFVHRFTSLSTISESASSRARPSVARASSASYFASDDLVGISSSSTIFH